jgi:hypothetical protein
MTTVRLEERQLLLARYFYPGRAVAFSSMTLFNVSGV